MAATEYNIGRAHPDTLYEFFENRVNGSELAVTFSHECAVGFWCLPEEGS